MAQADATRKGIEGYEALADEATGPQAGRARRRSWKTLRAEKASLEQDKTANKDRLAELAKLIPAKEKELAAIAADPWIKRLEEQDRRKEEGPRPGGADSAAMAQATEKTDRRCGRRCRAGRKGLQCPARYPAEGAEEGQAQARA